MQPFWYYLPVVILATMPWTVLSVRAFIDGVQTSVAEWRLRHSKNPKLKVSRPGDGFPEFLVLWAIIPIVFFSLSKSKLPGYILPSIPPITILTGDYLFRRRGPGLNRWELASHAALTGALAFARPLPPCSSGARRRRCFLRASRPLIVALLAAIGAALLIVIVVNGFGVARLRLATSCVLVVLLLFFYGIGPFAVIPAWARTKHVIHGLDKTYSARPLAEKLTGYAPESETVAVFQVRRDMEYGLAFYRNHHVVNYEEDGVPANQHLLVARVTGSHGADLHTPAALEEYLEGRHFEPLFSWPEQGLEIYLVGEAESPRLDAVPGAKMPAAPLGQGPELPQSKLFNVWQGLSRLSAGNPCSPASDYGLNNRKTCNIRR